MSSIEKYKRFFTKEYLMGPNSFRLLDELIRRSPEGVRYDRTLDLGCGNALTSLFVANETDAKYVYAFDLWIPAAENFVRIRDNGLEDKIIPIHGDAMDMPFAQNYFDTVISVDAYHYFLADVMVYCQNMLDALWLDADAIVNAKMDQNEAKYPVEKCRGSNAKYDQL